MRIVLHLGLHRTGSTALQNALTRRRERLAEAGVWFAPLRELRPELTSAFGAADWAGLAGYGARKILARRLRAWARKRQDEGWGRVILSDETLAGELDDCLKGLGPYPHAEARLETLAEAFAEFPCQAVAALRETGAWTASAWAFGMSRRPQPDFSLARRAALSGARSWPDLAREMRAAFPDLTLWRAELYAARPRRIHRLVAGEAGAPIPAGSSEVNAALSARALEELDARRARGEKIDRPARRAIAETFPLGEHAPFAPWSAEEASALKTRYEAELREIRSLGIPLLPLPPRPEGRPGAAPQPTDRRARDVAPAHSKS